VAGRQLGLGRSAVVDIGAVVQAITHLST
jgi:hypothetical protein